MADSHIIAEILSHRVRIGDLKNIAFPVLIPNIKGKNSIKVIYLFNCLGFESFMQASAGVLKEISIFTAASESFCRKNVNCSIEETLERFRAVKTAAKEHGMRIRG